jgi:hypothetical protein
MMEYCEELKRRRHIEAIDILSAAKCHPLIDQRHPKGAKPPSHGYLNFLVECYNLNLGSARFRIIALFIGT